MYALIDTHRNDIPPAALTILPPFDFAIPPGQDPSLPRAYGAQLLDEDSAAALGLPSADFEPFMTPAAIDAPSDLPIAATNGCEQGYASTSAVSCHFGPQAARNTIVIVGDSHATQWIPAFATAATELGYSLYTFTKSACPFNVSVTALIQGGRRYVECNGWVGNVLKELQSVRPQLIIMSNSKTRDIASLGHTTPYEEAKALLADGYVTTWKLLRRIAEHVAVISDTPRSPFDVADCISARRMLDNACNFKANSSTDDPQTIAYATNPGLVQQFDLNRFICPLDECHPTVGGVLIYRDSQHITRSFALTLSSQVATLLRTTLKYTG